MNRTAFFIFTVLPFCLFSQDLTIKKIIYSDDLHNRPLADVRWLPGGNAFTFIKKTESGRALWFCNAQTGETRPFFDAKQPGIDAARRDKRFTLPSYQWSPDERYLLIPKNNDLYLFDVAARTTQRLTNDEAEERDPLFSPDGRKLAYLKRDNLVLYDLASQKETELTNFGDEELLIGRFDWTFEEEFSIRTGFEWGPNSQKISFFQVDVSRIPKFPIVDFSAFRNTVELMRYAKAGDPNAEVKIGVVDVNSKKIVWMDCIGDPDSSYISRTSWFPDGRRLAVTWLNRRQNHLKLLSADVRTGDTKTILEEKSSTGWLEPKRKPLFINGGSTFIWLSEKDGFNHIYKIDPDTRQSTQLTHGRWDVQKLVGADERFVYFTAYKERYIDLDFYRIGVDGDGPTRLSQRSGVHGINMSPNKQFYLDTFSSVASPASVSLHYADGGRIVQLTTAAESAQSIMKEVDFDFFTIPLPGRTLQAMMMKPADFDSTRPHPLLIHTYGGPGSHLVRNSWHHPRSLWHKMLLDKGFLVLFMDGRGSSGRGAAWKHSLYKRLGDYEIRDQIDGAKWAAKRAYVDGNRIGMWGWSYGGYTTIMSLLKSSGLFKVGVAVAPVTDWRNYDSIYTERFMDLPDSNAKGYDVGSALPIADQLTSRLYLIHGSSDYNVHLSNTMQLVQKLQDNDKDFRLMVYPGKTHGLYGASTRVHVYEQVHRFILENL